MIHLTTGGPGAGKTLFTFSWVYALWKETGRPVCYTSHLKLKGEALNWGWKQIDIQKWEDEPDGTIFLVDEAQLVFRKRGNMSAPPAWVENLTMHRHRGFDFFLVTQQPGYLDTYLRGLIASPGWHRQIKRKWGSSLAAVLEWETFYLDAGDLTSGTTANSVQHMPYPKQHYDHYVSTSLNTVKFKVPRAAWFFVAAFLIAALLLAFVYSRFGSGLRASEPDVATTAQAVSSVARTVSGVVSPGGGDSAPKTAQAYIAERTPRIADLAYSAPVYDEVTRPVRAPYPAACMLMGSRCRCYSQQATRLTVSDSICRHIVKTGLFLDWDHTEKARADREDSRSSEARTGSSVAVSAAPGQPAVSSNLFGSR